MYNKSMPAFSLYQMQINIHFLFLYVTCFVSTVPPTRTSRHTKKTFSFVEKKSLLFAQVVGMKQLFFGTCPQVHCMNFM